MPKFTTSAIFITIVFSGLLLTTGCASFVNIPAEKGDTAINAVNLPPVPGVMADALAYAVNLYPAEGAIAIALPAPAKPRSFDVAMNKVGHGAAPWSGPADVRPTYRILAVHIRGSAAIVDVLLPAQLNLLDNKYLLEINLTGRFRGWTVRSVKRQIVNQAHLNNAAPPAGQPATMSYPDQPTLETTRQDEQHEPAPTSNQPLQLHDPAIEDITHESGPTTNPMSLPRQPKTNADDDQVLRPIRPVKPPKR